MKPEYWDRAKRSLARGDTVMASIMRRHPRVHLEPRGDAFHTLARAIVGQQISVKAAQSVWARFAARVGVVTPAAVCRCRSTSLRACGLSTQKTAYLKDLALRFAGGALEAASWNGLDDEALIAELTQVKGIGRWTAEMFLIFYLTRPDVLPVADLGLQKAMRLSYNRGRPLTPQRMQKIATAWAPWRSVATWYLWRSLDPIPVEY